MNTNFIFKQRKRATQLEQWLISMQKKGRYIYGRHFSLPSHNRQLLYLLFIYSTGNKEAIASVGMDPVKGILLIGGKQSGKTALLHLMRFFVTKKKRYHLRSCKELVLNPKLSLDLIVQSNQNVGYCLDDLGNEKITYRNGSSKELFHEVLLLCQQKVIWVHATSSLSLNALNKRYDLRVEDVFNVLKIK